MNVSVTVNRENERTYMKTFTIDYDNNITAFPTPDHAEAAVGAGSQSFTSPKQLAQLAVAWPAERLVEIWNSLPGVEPVPGFKGAKTAAGRIWGRIQNLGENPEPKAPTKAPSAKQAREGARPGSKTAAVVALLERKGGATLADLRKATGWQAHSVRGFISGTLGKRWG
jgi:hypothetical protein